jgi:hypothetical protein
VAGFNPKLNGLDDGFSEGLDSEELADGVGG